MKREDRITHFFYKQRFLDGYLILRYFNKEKRIMLVFFLLKKGFLIGI